MAEQNITAIFQALTQLRPLFYSKKGNVLLNTDNLVNVITPLKQIFLNVNFMMVGVKHDIQTPVSYKWYMYVAFQ